MFSKFMVPKILVRKMFSFTRVTLWLVLLFFCFQNFLFASPVTGLSALCKNGQVFCTWTNLSSTGIEYRLYKSSAPIIHGSDLASCQYLGSVRDSSSYNKRLSLVKM